MPRSFFVLVFAVLFLAGCQTNNFQKQGAANYEYLKITIKSNNSCLAENYEKYAGTDIAKTFGLQDRRQTPLTTSQLSNPNYISEKEIQELKKYYLNRYKCDNRFIVSTAHHPKLSHAARKFHADKLDNITRLFSKEISIGRFLEYDLAITQNYLQDFPLIINDIKSGVPARQLFATSLKRDDFRKPVFEIQVDQEDVNMLFTYLNENSYSGASPLTFAYLGQNSNVVSSQSNTSGQIVIKRRGNNFVFRLFLRLHETTLKFIDTFPREENFYNVGTVFQKQNNLTQLLRLGFVNLSDMERKQTPRGIVLDSGWIYSPSFRTSSDLHLPYAYDAGDKRDFEINYKFVADLDKPIYKRPTGMLVYNQNDKCSGGCKNSLILTWQKSKFLERPYKNAPEHGVGLSVKEHIETQFHGDIALTALEQGDTIYKTIFADYLSNIKKRKEIKAWLKRNFRPVAPYELAFDRCGKMPNLSTSTRTISGVIVPIYDVDGARKKNQRELSQLRKYTNCFQKLQRTFDYDRYSALLDNMEEVKEEWLDARGFITRPNTGYADERIAGYNLVAPENIENFFEYRMARLTNPKLAIKHEQQKIAQAARDRDRRRAEDRERRRQKQANQINIAQRFIASQNAINQTVLNNLNQTQQIINQAWANNNANRNNQAVSRQKSFNAPSQQKLKTASNRNATSMKKTAKQELPPVMNNTYWVVFGGGSAQYDTWCENPGLIGDTSRVVCKHVGSQKMARIDNYFCDAPEGEPLVEAVSSTGKYGHTTRTYFLRGVTKAQIDDLRKGMGSSTPGGPMAYYVDITEIGALRTVEDSWINSQYDAQGRELYFRNDTALVASVIKYCGKGGLAAWDVGADRYITGF